MSGASSSAAGWSTLLDFPAPATDLLRRPDDPRLGEVVEFWTGAESALRPGRAVLIGFPQDEGVRRNHGRVGAAQAPRTLRHCLWRLTPTDPTANVDLRDQPPLDLGDVRVSADLEESQAALGAVVGAVLQRGSVPIVLGGGHETAYGHFLGYAQLGLPVAVVNIDAHLDVRPLIDGRGHSGSPFRQMLEHATQPLPGANYACLGAQPHAVSCDHLAYARSRGCRVDFAPLPLALPAFAAPTMLTIDADAFHVRDVPGVSAPNAAGYDGGLAFTLARQAGQAASVRSMDLVEICPPLDRDGQSGRWGALVLWNFLMGLALRAGTD